MNIKNKFLTLSMKSQICIVLLSLNLFCVSAILLFYGSFTYEILNKDFNQKKLYFYDKYKEYIEGCFYFQNFYLLQYEEIIKRLHRQIWEFQECINVFKNKNKKFNVLEIDDNYYNFSNKKQYKEIEQIVKNERYLFYSCFSEFFYICFYEIDYIAPQYNMLSSQITSSNINEFNSLKIPMYDNISIISFPLFVDLYANIIYSFDPFRIFQKVNELCGDILNKTKITSYYYNRFFNIYYEIIDIVKFILIDPPSLIEQMFGKIINEIKEDIPNYISLYKSPNLFSKILGYISKIDYGNSQMYLIKNVESMITYFYEEIYLIL